MIADSSSVLSVLYSSSTASASYGHCLNYLPPIPPSRAISKLFSSNTAFMTHCLVIIVHRHVVVTMNHVQVLAIVPASLGIPTSQCHFVHPFSSDRQRAFAVQPT